MRPATRIGDVIIFEGGTSRPLTEYEKLLLDDGATVYADPRSGAHTPKVGEVCGGCSKRGTCLVPGAPRCVR